MKAVFLVIFIALVLLAVGVYFFIEKPEQINQFFTSKIDIMTITSPSFENSRFIPSIFSCDGSNISPAFAIAEVPKDAKSLALIVNDPDAPSGNFIHWIMWNIDSNTKNIRQESTPTGAMEGTNSAGYVGYAGPCPPSGTHHYVFKLYALDTLLELESATTESALKRAIVGHILAEAELIGLYGRIK
ncbi:hypothetical protein A3A18_00920 [Candidatus Azambacteria bacterium RIFCSPLOWO2_01_FULL_44_84]|nr:MAG: hypothetical protein A3A18_00920 [Candidatus Azambacteria bacterium RIFCSPLOWO2_01_FULL_44_84]